MSHFVTVNTQIKDITALRTACEEMGLALIANAEARGFSTHKTRGDYIIKLKGPYDIALNKQKDGAYGLTTDWWGSYVEKEVGKNYGRLLQLYAVHKATIEARKKGHLVKRQTRQTIEGEVINLLIGGV
ncbi:MAG: DUF1257 domain-containing protein [Verrucomicrobiae bacterium]|nr:DUF1257 domain-containing protein [Verrucomicrobiae bacterium]